MCSVWRRLSLSGQFNTYGSGHRGDMQATIAAILLDPEARRGDDPNTAVATDGKLREPVVMDVSVWRGRLAPLQMEPALQAWRGAMSPGCFQLAQHVQFLSASQPDSANHAEWAGVCDF